MFEIVLMPFLSITRLKVGSISSLLPFMRANEASAKQLAKTPGLIAGKELIDKNLTFWTMTLWENDSRMLVFRNSAAHRIAMQNLPFWCNEASYFHWIQESRELPGWLEASQRLIKEGKLTKVRKPTARHIANDFPPVKWTKIERIFKIKVPQE